MVRRSQFSLKALLIFVCIVATVLFITLRYLLPPLQHRLAVHTVMSAGGSVLYVEDYASKAPRAAVPYSSRDDSQNPWRDVLAISLVSDAAIRQTADTIHLLPELNNVDLGFQVTDTGLDYLCRSQLPRSFDTLGLGHSKVTSKGIASIQRLEKLKLLMLNTVPAGDDGLKQLKNVNGLEALYLYEEGSTANPKRYSEEGLLGVTDIPALKKLHLVGLQLPDGFLNKIKTLSQMEYLLVARCQVSNAALDEIREALPDCEIVISP